MDIELKQKWVAALRSGEYEQVTGGLRKDGGYCCLGVLCHVAGMTDLSGRGFLPPEFADQVGVNFAAEGKLVDMNDEHHNSFAEIADYIEANL